MVSCCWDATPLLDFVLVSFYTQLVSIHLVSIGFWYIALHRHKQLSLWPGTLHTHQMLLAFFYSYYMKILLSILEYETPYEG